MPNPRDWIALGTRLKNWSPPENAFDPSGKWNLVYDRHFLIPQRDGKPGGTHGGFLRLNFTPQAQFSQLQVVEKEKTGFTTLITRAHIKCAKDTLTTPQRWSLNCIWENPQKVVDNKEMDQQLSGHVDAKEIVYKGSKERRIPAPASWTSFWNLFAAIQLIPFKADNPLMFDMFESFDLHKAGQRLMYAGKHKVSLNKRELDLHVFEQTGRGIMPWHWWLDDNHRILLAAGNRRAYLLNQSGNGGKA